MLELIAAFITIQKFVTLAHNYNRNRWVFGILALVVFFVSEVLTLLILEYNFRGPGLSAVFVRTLLAIGAALLVCYALYWFLENSWKKKKVSKDSDLIDETYL